MTDMSLSRYIGVTRARVNGYMQSIRHIRHAPAEQGKFEGAEPPRKLSSAGQFWESDRERRPGRWTAASLAVHTFCHEGLAFGRQVRVCPVLPAASAGADVWVYYQTLCPSFGQALVKFWICLRIRRGHTGAYESEQGYCENVRFCHCCLPTMHHGDAWTVCVDITSPSTYLEIDRP
jgi:hypothetical protein